MAEMVKKIRRGRWLAALAVCAITMALFAAGVSNGHLHMDDYLYTHGCPFVKSGLSVDNIVSAFTDFGYGSIWMPVTFITYMADITLFGSGWEVNHAVNVLLHGVNSGLVFLLFWMMIRRLVPDARESDLNVWCVIGALLWSLHPMRIESVVLVSSRKEELWSMFAFGAMITWIRYLYSSGMWKRMLVFALFILSVLSKPTAVCLPFLLYIIQVALRRGKSSNLKFYGIMVLVSVVIGRIAIYSQANPTGMAQVDIFDACLLWRIFNAAVSIGLYVWHAFVPTSVHMDYLANFNGWPKDGALGSAVFAILCVMIVVVLGRGKCSPVFRRLTASAGVWFLLALAPTLGVVAYVNGDQAMADRYTYMPFVACSLWLAYVGVGGECRPLWKRVRMFAVGVLVLEASLLSSVIGDYKNDSTVFHRVLRIVPDHWRALRYVGSEYCANRDTTATGISMIRKSFQINPLKKTADSLAYILAISGDADALAEVKQLCAGVIRNPESDEDGMMLDALGIVALRESKDDAAVFYLSKAICAPRRTHTKDYAMLNLGVALANCGRTHDALDVLGKVSRTGGQVAQKSARETIALVNSGSPRRISWKEK